MKKCKVALCQIIPSWNISETVDRAVTMVEEAAGNGADFVVFPEMFYHPYELLAIYRITVDADSIVARFQNLARENGVHICTGSMVVKKGTKRFNTSHLIDTEGNIRLVYSKCHLFDAELGEVRAKESLVFSYGEQVPIVKTALGSIGINICYDIRFPEMARYCALQGAEVLCVPAVFNQETGPAHWECFMRTRAIENQLFVVAVSQGRDTDPKVTYKAYGHSMVVSPWGDVLAEAGIDETIMYADLDPEVMATTRKRLPLLQHRRDKLYTSFK